MNHLKALRQKAGLSLEGLASAAEMSKSNLWALEQEGANPRLKTAYVIAALLQVPVMDIWPSDVEIIEVTTVTRRLLK